MFYENLLKECTRQGLKITPLVKECGGAAGSISAWKKGAMPNSEIVLKLAKRLNVSSDYLLGLSDTKEPATENDSKPHMNEIIIYARNGKTQRREYTDEKFNQIIAMIKLLGHEDSDL